MKLGIIGAMQVEVENLVEKLENSASRNVAGSTYYEGKLEGLDVVVVQCGVGKVNAALCAQILCDCFGVTHILNIFFNVIFKCYRCVVVAYCYFHFNFPLF